MRGIFPFCPYAAKAIVQHEFDTDHLNIWVTFAFSMNIKKTPTADFFTAVCDGAQKPASIAVWQDAYTLRLTIPAIASAPARVLLKYEGPTPDLEISYHKQWEPFGLILSLDVET